MNNFFSRVLNWFLFNLKKKKIKRKASSARFDLFLTPVLSSFPSPFLPLPPVHSTLTLATASADAFS